MTQDDSIIISTDSHVSEPIDLYGQRMDAAFRDRAPRIENKDGWRTLYVEGYRPRKLMTESELDITVVGGFDPDQRLREQSQDGVSAEVIFPTFALQACFASGDAGLQGALCRAYNDWALERLGGHHRMLPVALIPMLDVDDAIAEANRVTNLGFRALFLPARVPSRPYNDPEYDRFWAVASDLGLPLTFHSGTGYEPRIARGEGAAVINYILGAQLDGPTVMLEMAAGGALDRFPGLRIVTVETGAAWLAWIMTQADLIYEAHAIYIKKRLTMKPSELIARQAHATFMNDPVAINNRHITGIEAIMWGNDYPHPEGTWPHSADVLDAQFKDVPEVERRAMVCGTAARVFGFEVDRLVPAG
jgi:predicted TIM-barrel fold metal-dependent hydrolase